MGHPTLHSSPWHSGCSTANSTGGSSSRLHGSLESKTSGLTICRECPKRGTTTTAFCGLSSASSTTHRGRIQSTDLHALATASPCDSAPITFIPRLNGWMPFHLPGRGKTTGFPPPATATAISRTVAHLLAGGATGTLIVPLAPWSSWRFLLRPRDSWAPFITAARQLGPPPAACTCLPGTVTCPG